jgi:hypothetical protein
MNQSCDEKARLSDAVLKAVGRVCSAKVDYNCAIKEKRDIRGSQRPLADAQVEERRAVAALDKHKEDHGCVWAA